MWGVQGRYCTNVYVSKGKPRSPCRVCHYAATRAYAKKNPERTAAYKKKYAEGNKERRRETCRRYRTDRADRAKASADKWRAANKGKTRAQVRKRQARLAQACPSWLSDEQYLEIQRLYTEAFQRELADGVKYEVDHIEPLQGEDRCGLHVLWNLRIVPRTVNRVKGNKPIKKGAH